ncbi:MAG: hydroxymethylglutaryl-CoA reductase, degradative [Pseudomonadota bacterium]
MNSKRKRKMIKSELPGFHRLRQPERCQRIADIAGLRLAETRVLSGEKGLTATQADTMVENVLGVMGVPLSLCPNLRINGEDVLVPMAIEEPSVVAAASFAAKLLRTGDGIQTRVSPPLMIGQIQLLDVPDAQAAEVAILQARKELLAKSNAMDPWLVAAGGGAVDVEVRHLPPLNASDPVGPMVVVHLIVDVRDAMGANAINTMCEGLAPSLEELTGGRVRLRILSNLTDKRTVVATGHVPFELLKGKGGTSPYDLAKGIEEASVFAERDSYRATTHNKGIMNGVDAVLLAFGQDWRAVEAGAHAFAGRSGHYSALAKWRVGAKGLDGHLEIPMAVGTIGGITCIHPTVKVAYRIAKLKGASDLASIAAAMGLAQNLAALRALAAEGIQYSHMRMHARKVAAEAGAVEHEVENVARCIAEQGALDLATACAALKQHRAPEAIATQQGRG